MKLDTGNKGLFEISFSYFQWKDRKNYMYIYIGCVTQGDNKGLAQKLVNVSFKLIPIARYKYLKIGCQKQKVTKAFMKLVYCYFAWLHNLILSNTCL